MTEEIKDTNQSGTGNFIQTFIEQDIAEGGQFEGETIHTRFPART